MKLILSALEKKVIVPFLALNHILIQTHILQSKGERESMDHHWGLSTGWENAAL